MTLIKVEPWKLLLGAFAAGAGATVALLMLASFVLSRIGVH